MSYKEKKIEKKYFTIGDVAEQFGVTTSLLRFWESEFDEIRPKKNRKGNRQYIAKDISVIAIIHRLVKKHGFTIWGARQFLHNHRKVCPCCHGLGLVGSSKDDKESS